MNEILGDEDSRAVNPEGVEPIGEVEEVYSDEVEPSELASRILEALEANRQVSDEEEWEDEDYDDFDEYYDEDDFDDLY